jgi:hypothetical protein
MEDSLDQQLRVKQLRLATEPSDYEDRTYFKKPLRLLKKKLKENRMMADFTRKFSN